MRIRLNRRVVTLIGLFALLGSRTAHATDPETVETLIRQGVELRQQAHDERAFPLFQKAYGIARTPRTAGQLGLCEMALGYWLDAERHLTEALNVPEHPWVAKNLGDLSGAVASVRKNIGDVLIDGGPDGAEVFVNGHAAAHLPLSAPLRLGKGAADLELRLPGYATAARSLSVRGGVEERVTINLEKNPVAANPGDSAIEVTRVTPTAPAGDGASAIPSPAISRQGLGWAAAGTGALALGFAAVETVLWAQRHNDFENHSGPLPSDPTMSGHNCGGGETDYGGPDCAGLHDSLVRARNLAIVGYGLATALGVTSAVLFATSGRGQPKAEARLTCVPSLAERGIGCEFTF